MSKKVDYLLSLQGSWRYLINNDDHYFNISQWACYLGDSLENMVIYVNDVAFLNDEDFDENGKIFFELKNREYFLTLDISSIDILTITEKEAGCYSDCKINTYIADRIFNTTAEKKPEIVPTSTSSSNSASSTTLGKWYDTWSIPRTITIKKSGDAYKMIEVYSDGSRQTITLKTKIVGG